jgi:putative MATE family efflux protein
MLEASTAPLRRDLIEDPGLDRKVFVFEPVLLKRIVWLGWPVIIGMLTQTAINQVDTLFVGRLDDRTAVAGVAALGISTILLWACGGSLSAIAVGTQALTARRFGEGNLPGAGKVLFNSMILAVVLALMATGLAELFVVPLFEVLHKDPTVQAVGEDFCRIRFLGILPMVLTASIKSFYDGVGRVFVHMTVAILMNVVNLFFAYVLVFGELGFPRLEVEGAAWAAVISAAFGCALMILWSLHGKDRTLFKTFRIENFDLKTMWAVFRPSFFSGVAMVFVMMGFGMFFYVVGEIDRVQGLPGVNASATWDIISITMLIFLTCIAFGTSTSTLVSQSMGARNPNLAARYGWQSVIVIVLLMSALGLLMSMYPEAILSVFMPDSVSSGLKEQVIAVATPSLRFCGVFAPIAAGGLVFTQALYGAGESRFVMIVEGIGHFGILVPLAYVFAIKMEMGLIGCWYAAAIYGLVLAVATGVKFYRGKWKHTVM